MKKSINIILMALVAAFGGIMVSCSDDENNMSRAVLASTDVLEYETLPVGPQIITVTSDADWVCEAPEWATVKPATGHAGRTEVEISVSDNLRDGTPDNPRKADVLFKGRNLESIAKVLLRQDGDKFRDPVDYTIADLNDLEDETVVRMQEMVVTALTANGFIATDGERFIFFQEPVEPVAVGDKVTVQGEKHKSDMSLPYVLGERMWAEGTAPVPAAEATDITADLDNTTAGAYQLITVTGDLEGDAMTVGEMTCKVYLTEPAEALNIPSMNGHKIKVKGYFAGMASPVINVIPAEYEDLGLNETIYFADDFEWMDPWSIQNKAVDYIALSDTQKSQSIQIGQPNADGKTMYDELIERGYDFVKATAEGKEDRPIQKRVYFQRNYLKFSLTGIEAGLVLPKFQVPEAEDYEILFDWSPMRQGDPGKDGRKYDDIKLIIIIENDGVEEKINVPPHTLKAGGKHEWMHVQINLSKYKINENTKVTIRSSDDRWPALNDKGEAIVNRFFLDNIKVRQTIE